AGAARLADEGGRGGTGSDGVFAGGGAAGGERGGRWDGGPAPRAGGGGGEQRRPDAGRRGGVVGGGAAEPCAGGERDRAGKERVQGWELDEAAAAEIRGAGLGPFIRHRTGHSLSPGPMVHGLGMNLDNLETRDTREMLAGIGFTVEPGAYLPEFGVRLEINL